MMYYEKPEWYTENLQVWACIIEAEGKVLLLQQWKHKSDWWIWLEPGWKVQNAESFEQAMLREVYEETWLKISSLPYKKLFQRYFEYKWENITLEMYYVKYTRKPKIVLSEEHSNYIWLSPCECLDLNLVEDLDIILKELYDI